MISVRISGINNSNVKHRCDAIHGHERILSTAKIFNFSTRNWQLIMPLLFLELDHVHKTVDSFLARLHLGIFDTLPLKTWCICIKLAFLMITIILYVMGTLFVSNICVIFSFCAIISRIFFFHVALYLTLMCVRFFFPRLQRLKLVSEIQVRKIRQLFFFYSFFLLFERIRYS